MKRPSRREIDRKITEAKKAVDKNDVLFVSPDSLAIDALELGYIVEEEIQEVLAVILNEINADHYVWFTSTAKSLQICD